YSGFLWWRYDVLPFQSPPASLFGVVARAVVPDVRRELHPVRAQSVLRAARSVEEPAAVDHPHRPEVCDGCARRGRTAADRRSHHEGFGDRGIVWRLPAESDAA